MIIDFFLCSSEAVGSRYESWTICIMFKLVKVVIWCLKECQCVRRLVMNGYKKTLGRPQDAAFERLMMQLLVLNWRAKKLLWVICAHSEHTTVKNRYAWNEFESEDAYNKWELWNFQVPTKLTIHRKLYTV